MVGQTAINAEKIVNVIQEIVVEFGRSKDVGSVVKIRTAHLARTASMFDLLSS